MLGIIFFIGPLQIGQTMFAPLIMSFTGPESEIVLARSCLNASIRSVLLGSFLSKPYFPIFFLIHEKYYRLKTLSIKKSLTTSFLFNLDCQF